MDQIIYRDFIVNRRSSIHCSLACLLRRLQRMSEYLVYATLYGEHILMVVRGVLSSLKYRKVCIAAVWIWIWIRYSEKRWLSSRRTKVKESAAGLWEIKI